ISTRQWDVGRLSMRAMSWLACKFKSTINTRLPFKARAQAILTATKVLPTPPLLLKTVMILGSIVVYLTTILNFVADDLNFYTRNCGRLLSLEPNTKFGANFNCIVMGFFTKAWRSINHDKFYFGIFYTPVTDIGFNIK